MMRDIEYRDAIAEMLSETGRDIFVEVAGNGGVDQKSVILTDIMPSDIDEGTLTKLRSRTVFLSTLPVSSRDTEELHVLFKYSSISVILAEISAVHSEWSGDSGSLSLSTKVIAVVSESDQMSSERCRALAAQILYIHGGSVIVIPLGYVNDHHRIMSDDAGAFRRLMYMIDEKKDYSPDCCTVTDSYGISYMMLPEGVNPIAELDHRYLSSLINSLGNHFDTVILDIGTCFSKDNLQLISCANDILFFGSGRRLGPLEGYIGKKQSERTRRIESLDAKDEAIAIDDFVRGIYGNGKTAQTRNDS